MASKKVKQKPNGGKAPALTVTITLDPYSVALSQPAGGGSALWAAANLASTVIHRAWLADKAGVDESLSQRQRIEQAAEVLTSSPQSKLRRQEAALLAVHAFFEGKFPIIVEPPELRTLCLAIDLALNPHSASILNTYTNEQRAAERRVEQTWTRHKDWAALNALFRFWKLDTSDERSSGNLYGGKTHKLAMIWNDLRRKNRNRRIGKTHTGNAPA